MSDEVKKYLTDILKSIQAVNEYIGSTRKFENYKSNQQLQDAVERRLEIIGEATSRILKINPQFRLLKHEGLLICATK